MNSALKFLAFFAGLPLAALAASTVVGGWVVAVVLIVMVVYTAGALASAWTFLGEAASIRV